MSNLCFQYDEYNPHSALTFMNVPVKTLRLISKMHIATKEQYSQRRVLWMGHTLIHGEMVFNILYSAIELRSTLGFCGYSFEVKKNCLRFLVSGSTSLQQAWLIYSSLLIRGSDGCCGAAAVALWKEGVARDRVGTDTVPEGDGTRGKLGSHAVSGYNVTCALEVYARGSFHTFTLCKPSSDQFT